MPTGPPSGSASPSPTSSAACSRRKGSRWRCLRGNAPGAGSSWTSACSIRRPRSSRIRPESTSPPARRRERLGNRHPTIVPYETFAAADGDLVIAVGNDEQWRRFCAVAVLEETARDPRFVTNRLRVENYEALRPLLAQKLRTRPRDEWLKDLTSGGRAVRRGARRAGGAGRPTACRPRDGRRLSTTPRSAPCKSSAFPSSCQTRRARFGPRRRRWGSTRMRSCVRISDCRRKRCSGCGRTAQSSVLTLVRHQRPDFLDEEVEHIFLGQ